MEARPPDRFQPLRLTRGMVEAAILREEGRGVDLDDCQFGDPRPNSNPIAGCACRKCEHIRAQRYQSEARRKRMAKNP